MNLYRVAEISVGSGNIASNFGGESDRFQVGEDADPISYILPLIMSATLSEMAYNVLDK